MKTSKASSINIFYKNIRVLYIFELEKEKYKLEFKYSDKYYIDEYYDDAKVYYKKFEEFPQYNGIVRDKYSSGIRILIFPENINVLITAS